MLMVIAAMCIAANQGQHLEAPKELRIQFVTEVVAPGGDHLVSQRDA